ncbi:MAG TPA: hypothetical protein VIH24_06105 [Candidatus Limnocylindria bacterium]|jgi:hypothetical protein
MKIDSVRQDLSKKADTARSEVDALFWLIRTAIIGLVVGAVYVELRKAPEERTWNGKLLGVVPYDFRIPSLDRVRQAYWNPRSPKVFTDRPLGVGWAVNIPTALRRLGLHAGFTKGR